MAPSIPLDPTASYLITGGLGALGLQVAQSLANDGAKQLVLVGRRTPDPKAQAKIAALVAQGITVTTKSVDLTDRDAVADLMATLPQLKGIVHCAGTLKDKLLAQAQWDDFAPVLGPKVTGTWLLHDYSKRLKLDFFVLFSSVASLLGSLARVIMPWPIVLWTRSATIVGS
ncbi:MAG: SDR family NAD(P)-dependent oxidoreductase [Synechococcaceae cyanobacterium RL_1_2]|nr:SDR family NAD(P)-dependent oxidoreductase [Synechococcaceae cyanobacterium RL_1_2]